ncbi:MAG: Lar family restriction alleviation protein [Synergistaceae bacterium]|nr:Lar family restriction alleviation protein [Synergistaceae bacterium]
MNELKTCPFCDGKAKLWEGKKNFYPYDYSYRIICTKCHVMTNLFTSREEAVASWNRRAA